MKFSWDRPLSDYAKVQAFIGSITRNRRLFSGAYRTGCYLNLGCGPWVDSRYVNIDYNWRPNIDLCWDVTRGLPFSDGYCGGIYTEHMLEHLTFHEARAVLRECNRVLMPGALLRVIVPDGEIYLREYVKHLDGTGSKIPYQEEDRSEYNGATAIYSVNRIFRYHGHRFIWDAEAMSAALREAGFTDVAKKSFRVGDDATLLLDSPSRAAESLYIEARASLRS